MPSFAEVKDAIDEMVYNSDGLKTSEVIGRLPKEMLIFDIPSIIGEMIEAKRLGAIAATVSADRTSWVLLSPRWAAARAQPA